AYRLYIFNDPSKQSLVLLASLRSAEPSIMTRFFKNRQTFFAFFRFSQPLHWEAAAVRVFCGAFDYDTVFSTSSTSRGFFSPASHFDQLATRKLLRRRRFQRSLRL
ncbi:hypothetical protein QTI17_13900, partial [Variovorax sp. J31P179]|uniref:hypothetical protein n=1 Tax=Variovorax sp. J31P179 TaxID=3053508 RepID=UPI002579025E